MNTRQLSIAAAGALFAAATAFAPAAFAVCNECGTVTDVRTIKKQGEGSGVGAVIGGVAGGVLGHQVGNGRGNDAATVVGAVGGAYVGNEVEKNKKSTTLYEVRVKLEDGSSHSFNFSGETSYRVGDRVKVVDRKLMQR
jgi:outer membrane lipoprotein SlyB